MREVFYIIALSLGSVATIFILTKLMGYRQMSQMSMFDYINGITIGSITLSWISSRSLAARRVIEGKPLILLNHGELYRENLKKSKIDVSEFLVQCRVNGYFDISKLETAILEGNGKISFLPKATDRPVTASDMDLTPQQEYMVANVILDGRVMEENLRHTGKDEKWLQNQIKGQGADRVEDVLLATCDVTNQVTVFLKSNRRKDQSVLM